MELGSHASFLPSLCCVPGQQNLARHRQHGRSRNTRRGSESRPPGTGGCKWTSRPLLGGGLPGRALVRSHHHVCLETELLGRDVLCRQVSWPLCHAV